MVLWWDLLNTSSLPWYSNLSLVSRILQSTNSYVMLYFFLHIYISHSHLRQRGHPTLSGTITQKRMNALALIRKKIRINTRKLTAERESSQAYDMWKINPPMCSDTRKWGRQEKGKKEEDLLRDSVVWMWCGNIGNDVNAFCPSHSPTLKLNLFYWSRERGEFSPNQEAAENEKGRPHETLTGHSPMPWLSVVSPSSLK